jgi:hypothetical protein
MTTERDPRTRTVLSWLREDLHENAERVLLVALGEVDATPQRRSWWPAWRFQDVNTQIKVLLAVAAVAVVALVGYQLLPSNTGGVGGQRSPLPSSTSSTAPSSAPTASADSGPPRLPASGSIEAGTYLMGSGPTFLITVPPGWVSLGTSIRKNLDQPNEVAFLLYRADIDVFADACESAGTEERIGPTAEDLIAALVAQENSDIADPVDATVAGLPGTRLEVSTPASLDTSQCSIGSLQIWVDSSGNNYLSGLGPGGVVTAYVADTPGGRLLYVPGGEAEATSADIAERDAMIATIEIVE